jgi:hypothetical protein
MWFPTTSNLHVFSFIWIIHWTTNGSNSRFHFGVSTPSYPFQHAFQQDILSPLGPKFIMFWRRGECLAYNSTNFPKLLIISLVFSTTLWIQLGLAHPSIVGVFWCMCTHLIDPMGILLLRCAHGNERTRTHDAIHETFATIVWDAGFHVG